MADTINIKELEDYELVKLCISGDKNYFEEIVRRYKNLVYSVVLRMVNNTEDANDLAQEVFIKVYKNLDKYYPDFKLSTWIIRIATNHVIDFRRKKKYDTSPIEEYETVLKDEASPESILLAMEKKKTVNDMVDTLPDMYKIPVVLYHQQGLSYNEISEVINEPLSKVKNRIFRGRKLLKEGFLKMEEGGLIGL